MEIPIQENNELSEIYFHGVVELYRRHVEKNQKSGRKQWNDNEVHLIEPFMPGLCCVLDDIDENYIEHIVDAKSIYEISFNNNTFFLSSFDTSIDSSSYGQQGDLPIRHMYMWEENLKAYGTSDTKILINKVLELLEEFLIKLKNNDPLALQLLYKRSHRKTQR
ncbi:MAG: hypothetical protein ACMG57_00130 [Candidatus Dojkabacteria bacterium]